MPVENSYIYLNLTKENIIYAYKNNYSISTDQLYPSILLLDKKCCYFSEI